MRRVSNNHIVLSRKNVESLLHMLDNRDKTLPALSNGEMVVGVEENDVHYDNREYPMGQMSWEQKN